MNKVIKIFGLFFIVVGIVLMYVGYYMAQGKFYGVAYVKGDYTNFTLGCVSLIGGIILLAGPYVWNKISSRSHDKDSQHNVFNSGCIVKLLRIVAIIAIIIGVIDLIYGITKSTPNIFEGISVVISALVFYGLTYIIEAAIVYVKKNRE